MNLYQELFAQQLYQTRSVQIIWIAVANYSYRLTKARVPIIMVVYDCLDRSDCKRHKGVRIHQFTTDFCACLSVQPPPIQATAYRTLST
jgi:hypothetical protein